MSARRAVWLLGLGLAAIAPDGIGLGPGRASAQADIAPRRQSIMPAFDYDAALLRLQLRNIGRPGSGSAVAETAPVPPEPSSRSAVSGPARSPAEVAPAAIAGTRPAPEAEPGSPAAIAAPPAPVELVLPELPPAAVTITAQDTFVGAIAARLADGRGIWPARIPKREREAVAAFYAARDGKPLWLADRSWNTAATAVIASLGRAGEDALDPADYPAPRLGPTARADRPVDLAEAELKLSAAAILYARDARGGRLDPSRLSGLITPKLDLPGADAILTLLATAPDVGVALERYNPVYPGYLALKAKLAELRAHRPSQPMARAPRRQAGAIQVIAALDDVAPAEPGGLYANPRLEGDIAANMERWRWLPAEVASRYIFVNVPEFRLRLMENGRVAHETRVITGRPETPTPLFSGTMEYAIVNPSWYIPPSIMKKEILPGLAADPAYASRRGYEVIRRGNQISVRQPPGERNALGFIKFMFPNQHAVYLHDTPNRNLFSASRRAFSHGCVRVENPFQLADFVLGHEWSEQRLKKLIGRGERTIRTPQPLPVHLAYFTTSVDEFGDIRSYEDIYGYHRRVRTALGFPG